ncbi:methyltransferase domain-containing protein [Lyngbya confervoides]|uniref:Methyltransferase domain-containing protein n=1 Tax=Lyngbya confervoides BDU141951 TaxID=1574623 RepID=A0ABD4T9U0_9CYAN|nr:methyltransferase domain-containing protein [Lyngbya confervoides]MCM1985070.1 methyltransferase domain-containing protein [Lyngbya confervoides BDU141951]
MTSPPFNPPPFPLTERIQSFYDQSSALWEQVWGEHMHHGYYGPTGQTRVQSPQEAQRILIEEILAWSGIETSQALLDVGCGIGGSTLYLASKFRASATGITLSPVQANRAETRAARAGLKEHVQFHVADALAMPFADQSFDLVWSLESGEHMPDKQQFLRECCRVLKPGGRLVVATWCHRDCSATASALTSAEQDLLNHLYRLYHLPYVISIQDYRAIAQTLPLSNLQVADWSRSVAPFWEDVIKSALNPPVFWGIITAGWKTIEGALAIPLMMEGYRTGLIRYGLLAGTKQTSETDDLEVQTS